MSRRDDEYKRWEDDRSVRLRQMLSAAGIELEKPAADRDPKPENAIPAEPDRARIREILVAKRAPDRDLEWLTASCPSLEHALAYRPPRPPRRAYPPSSSRAPAPSDVSESNPECHTLTVESENADPT